MIRFLIYYGYTLAIVVPFEILMCGLVYLLFAERRQ